MIRIKIKEDKARISIRKSTYEDKNGWLIVGKDSIGRKVDIFTPDRNKADQIAKVIKSNDNYFDKVDSILIEKEVIKMIKIKEGRNTLSSSTKFKLNKEIHNLVTNTYFRVIPIDEIMEILERENVLLLQEDYTPWAGMLIGTDEQEYFTLGDKNQIKDDYGGGLLAYEPYDNAMLAMSWYKMGSGKYEIVAYIT